MTRHDTDTDSNMTCQDSDMTSLSTVRVTVEEAAKLLDVSVDAVRKRIERGTLRSEKIEKTRYVLLDGVMTHPAQHMTTQQDHDMTALVASMQDQIDTLKQQLEDRKEEARRKDAILLTMAQRIPELEAPSEARESPVTLSEEPASPSASPGRERPSWWRRVFGG
jgi:excisionase family DNA binding protein